MLMHSSCKCDVFSHFLLWFPESFYLNTQVSLLVSLQSLRSQDSNTIPFALDENDHSSLFYFQFLKTTYCFRTFLKASSVIFFAVLSAVFNQLYTTCSAPELCSIASVVHYSPTAPHSFYCPSNVRKHVQRSEYCSATLRGCVRSLLSRNPVTQQRADGVIVGGTERQSEQHPGRAVRGKWMSTKIREVELVRANKREEMQLKDTSLFCSSLSLSNRSVCVCVQHPWSTQGLPVSEISGGTTQKAFVESYLIRINTTGGWIKRLACWRTDGGMKRNRHTRIPKMRTCCTWLASADRLICSKNIL